MTRLLIVLAFSLLVVIPSSAIAQSFGTGVMQGATAGPRATPPQVPPCCPGYTNPLSPYSLDNSLGYYANPLSPSSPLNPLGTYGNPLSLDSPLNPLSRGPRARESYEDRMERIYEEEPTEESFSHRMERLYGDDPSK